MDIPKPHDFRTRITPPVIDVKPFVDAMENMEVAMIGTGLDLKEFGETIATPKREFVPKPHLTQRPFLNKDLVAFRNSLPTQDKKKRGKK